MRNGLLLLAGIGLLAGCSVELPGFAGREGNAAGMYTFRAPPPPEPQQVPLRQAEAERALHGVILRVRGETPSQGYYSAALRPIGTGPDAAGGTATNSKLRMPAASGPVPIGRSAAE